MISREELTKMSHEEKLQTMEALWEELSQEEERVESPTWHEEVLKETETRVAEGREQIAEWTDAKHELRRKFG